MARTYGHIVYVAWLTDGPISKTHSGERLWGKLDGVWLTDAIEYRVQGRYLDAQIYSCSAVMEGQSFGTVASVRKRYSGTFWKSTGDTYI